MSLIAAPFAILAILYAGGFLAQLLGNYATWKQGGGIPGDGTSPLAASPDFLLCLSSVLRPPYGVYGILICIGLLAVLLIMVMRMGYGDAGEYDEDRNFSYSAKGTYGTSGWMSRKEMSGVLDLVPDLRKHKGVVLGMLDGKAVCIPEDTRINSNLAVYGASGSMKTRSFCMNRILQATVRGENGAGESLIICDPKSELYEKSSEFLRSRGYCVKVFNLVSPENSDSWCCLAEVEGQELMAQLFVDVIIKNTTNNGKSDHFWDACEMLVQGLHPVAPARQENLHGRAGRGQTAIEGVPQAQAAPGRVPVQMHVGQRVGQLAGVRAHDAVLGDGGVVVELGLARGVHGFLQLFHGPAGAHVDRAIVF